MKRIHVLIRIIPVALLLTCSSGCVTNNTTNQRIPAAESLNEWSRSPLAHSGKIFLIGDLERSMATSLCQKLFVLEADDKVDRIVIYINSPGGDDDAYLAVVNTIKNLKKPVDTVNQGYCMSAAVGIHQAATGKRYAYKNSVFAIHSFRPKAGVVIPGFGKVLEYINEGYARLIRSRSSLPSQWFPLSETNHVFTAEEALKYHFVDEIISPEKTGLALQDVNVSSGW